MASSVFCVLLIQVMKVKDIMLFKTLCYGKDFPGQAFITSLKGTSVNDPRFLEVY